MSHNKTQLDESNEEIPQCPLCGGRNVVPAGKTEENCEDCGVFFNPGESTAWAYRYGRKVEFSEPPEGWR